MFSHDRGYEDYTQKRKRVDFYGNDGVCLFKYFVYNADPQRYFVWAILFTNFICFMVITISYTSIGISSSRSSEHVSSSNNQGNMLIRKRNQRMNRRISIIIGTDFVCWVPFVIICALHSLKLLDASPWYALFSMIILPINSVINPLLYDNFISQIAHRVSAKLYSRIANPATLIRARVHDLQSRSDVLELQDRPSSHL